MPSMRMAARGIFAAITLALLAPTAHAETRDVGNVALVEDWTGTIIYPPEDAFWGPDALCRETAKLFYRTHCDDYDALVVFQIKSRTDPILDAIRNVQQGTPVQNDVQGIGYTRWNWTSVYGSRGRLQQCVSMTSLYAIPDSPDGPATALFGLPLGITGIELLGHEFGHRWLMGIEFDKNDGHGRQNFIRGFESNGNSEGSMGSGSPNLHYSAWADSHSVMYGSFITDKGNGTYEQCGGVRKYSQLDQYLMGLRPARDVAPMMVLDDGSGQGNPSVPQSAGQCTTLSASQYHRVDVTIDDVVRAMGPRSTGATPNPWRVAFVLLTEQGTNATQAQIAKVEAYRSRFTQWFPTATDNLGRVETNLVPPACPLDAGVLDAGVHDGGPKYPDGGLDAGPPPHDAGPPFDDAGLPQDAGAPIADAGADEDAGIIEGQDGAAASDGGLGVDAGRRDGGGGVRQPSGGCSCDTQDGPLAGLLGFFASLVALASTRRRKMVADRE